MKVYKENSIKNPLYTAILDNGVNIFVYDGYAEGSDGKIYYSVIKETDEGEVIVEGWCREE